MNKVNLIGYGNVGFHLANHLSSAGVQVNVLSRSITADENSTLHFYKKANDLPKDADLCIICVNDDQIKEVAKQLEKQIPTVHTSGSKSIEILQDFKARGVLYPLQTFSRSRTVNLKNVPFLLEANSNELAKKLIDFCHNSLSDHYTLADSDKRKEIHLAAVFACNFSTMLWQISEKRLKSVDLDLSLLKPLIEETISKTLDLGPIEALTGPAKRGDEDVMNEHLKMLSNDRNARELYVQISHLIQKFSKQ